MKTVCKGFLVLWIAFIVGCAIGQPLNADTALKKYTVAEADYKALLITFEQNEERMTDSQKEAMVETFIDIQPALDKANAALKIGDGLTFDRNMLTSTSSIQIIREILLAVEAQQ